MSFTKSSSNIAVDCSGKLTAQCRRRDGQVVDATISLDEYLGNKDGFFIPGGSKFSITAQTVSLQFHSVLFARLQKEDGSWQNASIDLDRFIQNNDGALYADIDLIYKSTDDMVTLPSSSETKAASLYPGCTSIEASVSQCEDATKNFHVATNKKIVDGARIAMNSTQAVFASIEHTRHILKASETDMKPILERQSDQLSTSLATASRDWASILALASEASQETKEFQGTMLKDTADEIGRTEQEIVIHIHRIGLEKQRLEDCLCNLKSKIEMHRKTTEKADAEAGSANDRVIGFSVASVFLFPVFIPLAVIASKERGSWWNKADEFRAELNNALEDHKTHENALSHQENALRLANEARQRCKELQATVYRLASDIRNLETSICTLKENLTAHNQSLFEVETRMIDLFRYNQPLEDRLQILDEASELKSKVLALDGGLHLSRMLGI